MQKSAQAWPPGLRGQEKETNMTLEKRLAAASFLTVVAAAMLSASMVYGAVTLEPKIAASSLPRVPAPMPVTPVAEPEDEPDAEVDPVLAEQLAILIYREAGGDACCDDCRVRVADVALNRVTDERFPDTLEAVLTQKKQYGTMYWDGVTWPDRAENPTEAEAVARARETAEAVLSGTHSELYGNGYIFQSEFPDLGDDEGRVTCCGIYFAKG